MNTPSDDAPNPPDRSAPDDELLAAELMLGLLDPDAHRHALDRAQGDPAFARRVAGWDHRFAPWLVRYVQVTPRPAVWQNICRELGWTSPRRARPTLWNSLALWRFATAAAASAVLALVLLRPAGVPDAISTPTEEGLARPVTLLAHDDGRAAWLATVDTAQGKVLMVPVPGSVSAGDRICELWVIPQGGAPLSLGAVSEQKAHSVTLTQAQRRQLAAGAVLAVSLEDRLGVPHAAPAGPIVAKGEIRGI